MCGIIAAINTPQKKKKADPVNEWILNQYEDQHTRGQKGFGVIFIDPKGNIKTKRATEPLKFLVDLNLNESSGIIAHHRWPTSTDNEIAQTHPISVKNKSLKHDYLVVHNGIINNCKDVRIEHEKEGHKYTTDVTGFQGTIKFNDSETVAIEIARLIEGLTPIIRSRGSMAIIALQINKKTGKSEKIFFFRNTNPLNMSKTRGKLRLSSEGEGNEIEEKILYSCKIDKNMKLTKKKIEIAEYEYKAPVVSAYVYNNAGYKTTAVDFRDSSQVKSLEERNNEIIENLEKQIEEKTIEESTKQDEKTKNAKTIEIMSKLDIFYEKKKEEITNLFDGFLLQMECDPTDVDTSDTISTIEKILDQVASVTQKQLVKNGVLKEEEEDYEWYGRSCY